MKKRVLFLLIVPFLLSSTVNLNVKKIEEPIHTYLFLKDKSSNNKVLLNRYYTSLFYEKYFSSLEFKITSLEEMEDIEFNIVFAYYDRSYLNIKLTENYIYYFENDGIYSASFINTEEIYNYYLTNGSTLKNSMPFDFRY